MRGEVFAEFHVVVVVLVVVCVVAVANLFIAVKCIIIRPTSRLGSRTAAETSAFYIFKLSYAAFYISKLSYSAFYISKLSYSMFYRNLNFSDYIGKME